MCGNTGIALSMVGAVMGHRVVIMMPQSVSEERRNMIRSFGAELHLLEELLRMQAAVARTIELARGNQSIFLPGQFRNEDNPRCHEATTGPEILEQTGGRLDAFVMGVGRALRARKCGAWVCAVEPDESAVMSGDTPGKHGIQGLADGFIPEIVRSDEIDRIVRIDTPSATAMARRLAAEEGLFVGISAGANVLAAGRIAAELGPDHTVVTVLPDRGERYLSIAPRRTDEVSERPAL